MGDKLPFIINGLNEIRQMISSPSVVVVSMEDDEEADAEDDGE